MTVRFCKAGTLSTALVSKGPDIKQKQMTLTHFRPWRPCTVSDRAYIGHKGGHPNPSTFSHPSHRSCTRWSGTPASPNILRSVGPIGWWVTHVNSYFCCLSHGPLSHPFAPHQRKLLLVQLSNLHPVPGGCCTWGHHLVVRNSSSPWLDPPSSEPSPLASGSSSPPPTCFSREALPPSCEDVSWLRGVPFPGDAPFCQEWILKPFEVEIDRV